MNKTRITPRFESCELIVSDAENSNNIIKLEPRVIKVFQMLYDGKGNVVSRDHMIKEIWANYGTADEALTQAFSKLRKDICEAGGPSDLIETVPKRGYRLKRNFIDTESKKKYPISSIFWILLLIALLTTAIIYFLNENENKAPAVPISKKELNAPAPSPTKKGGGK